jgi:hypothetical protein
MTTNQRSILFLTVLLYVAFAGMIGFGIDLTYQSSAGLDQQQKETSLKMNASTDNVEIELTTAIPGIVLIVLGGAGLISMVFRVPTKEIVGYRQDRQDTGRMEFKTTASGPKPIYSNTITKIPLPVWFLIKRKRVFKIWGQSRGTE